MQETSMIYLAIFFPAANGCYESAFAVIPDAERLDIGSNKIIAIYFNNGHQINEEWAKVCGF